MKPITIIGGGLAGLTLGILLRRENVPVTVVEAGRYPRHRVCGEFLCGRGLEIFQTLDLPEAAEKFSPATESLFCVPTRPPIKFKVQPAALCGSRYDLDALLAAKFESLGGLLKTDARADGTSRAPGTVKAVGRRRAAPGEARLIGLKAHALNVPLSADLEMHFVPGRYVGMCRLPNGRVNVCGLFSLRKAQPNLHENWRALLSESITSHASKNIEWDEDSFCSVAALTMAASPPENEFAIGDAAAMIPPLTGNGMSMAFESAALALPHLLEYSWGRTPWLSAQQSFASSWRQTFRARLRWAGFLQNCVFNAAGQRFLYLLARAVPALKNTLFARTR